MKLSKKIISTVVFGLVSLPAYSANWVSVATGNKISVFLDTASVRTSNGKVKAWFMFSYSEVQNIANAYPPKRYQSDKDLIYIDCQQNTSAVAQINYYEDEAGAGAVVTSSNASVPLPAFAYTEVVPDSIGESMVARACAIAKVRS